MNIYNLPLWVIKPLSLIGRYFPKQVVNLRYFRQNKIWINWKHPNNLHQYTICQYFRPDTDLQLLGQLADKVRVRDFVKDRIGEQFLTKLYGVYDSASEIDFDSLPEQCVLKTNNGCGNNIIIRNKKQLSNRQKMKDLLDRWLRFPYGDLTGQVHYSYIKPQILAEEYLEQSAVKDILPYDYKFFCYKGKPLCVLYYEGRSQNGHLTPNMLFDMDWKPMKEAIKRPITHPIPKPVSFEMMKKCVTSLATGFDFVRVDFYEIKGCPIFGEMTFTPDISINMRDNFNPLAGLV